MTKKEIDLMIRNSTMMHDKGLAFLKSKIDYLVTNNIQGDIIECGTWMGGCSAHMAQALLEHKNERTLRIFDSFDDICEPSPIDGAKMIKQVGGIQNAQGRLQPVKGFYRNRKLSGPGNAKYVYNLLTSVVGYPKEKVKIYKGWFQKTIVPYSKRIDKVALLFLDCDLHVSIKLCLDNLYDKLVSNGVIIIDDYRCYEGCKKAVDDFLTARNIRINLKNISPAWWIKKNG